MNKRVDERNLGSIEALQRKETKSQQHKLGEKLKGRMRTLGLLRSLSASHEALLDSLTHAVGRGASGRTGRTSEEGVHLCRRQQKDLNVSVVSEV